MAGKMKQPAERWGRHTEIPQEQEMGGKEAGGEEAGGMEGGMEGERTRARTDKAIKE